jgi:hypothetical protein
MVSGEHCFSGLLRRVPALGECGDELRVPRLAKPLIEDWVVDPPTNRIE